MSTRQQKIFMLTLFILIFSVSCDLITNRIDNAATDTINISGRNLIISYDDSPLTDYTKMYPIHKKYNVPAEIGVWVNKIDFTNTQSKVLTINQLIEMKSNGIEIISHSYNHLNMAESTLIQSAKKGDLIIKTNMDITWTWARGSKLEIYDSEKSESISFNKVFNDGSGLCIQLHEPLENDFNTLVSFVRLSDESLNFEINNSYRVLNEYGLNVQGFTFPFSLYNDRSISVIKQNYKHSRTASPMSAESFTVFRAIYEDKIDNVYKINSIDFSAISKKQIISILDYPTSENFLIYMFSHTWSEACTEDLIEFLIVEALKRNIKITTRAELFQLEVQS